jgi:hypothetical protein
MPTPSDLQQLKENYVQHILEGMDMQTMEQLCWDLLMDAYDKCTWDEITEEITDLYDENTLIDLIPDAK